MEDWPVKRVASWNEVFIIIINLLLYIIYYLVIYFIYLFTVFIYLQYLLFIYFYYYYHYYYLSLSSSLNLNQLMQKDPPSCWLINVFRHLLRCVFNLKQKW